MRLMVHRRTIVFRLCPCGTTQANPLLALYIILHNAKTRKNGKTGQQSGNRERELTRQNPEGAWHVIAAYTPSARAARRARSKMMIR